MPVYAYKGMTPSGKSTKGAVNAESLRAARARMRQDGIFLTEIAQTDEVLGARGAAIEGSRFAKWNFDIKLFKRIPPLDRALATRQLSTLVSAGIPLVDSLGALVEQVEHAQLKAVLSRVRERVNEGSSLADAMSATEQFDDLYVSMIRAGESSGALDVVLARVADYLEEQVRLSNKVGAVLIYPAVMLAFAMVVVVALVTVVLPQITELLLSLDQPLPWYTLAIINGSDFARSWWWAMGLGALAVFFGMRMVIATERGRLAWDRMILKAPVIGKITRTVAIARFTRTLSTLLAGGVPIVRALDIGRHVANNIVLANAIDNARISIIEGASVAQPLRASGEFPPLVTHMIDVGEQSGALEAMLAKVAETYDEQVETTVTRLTSLMEPFLILIMVGIVLVIILATLMPLLQITSAIN